MRHNMLRAYHDIVSRSDAPLCRKINCILLYNLFDVSLARTRDRRRGVSRKVPLFDGNCSASAPERHRRSSDVEADRD